MGLVERTPRAKNQLDPSVRFYRTPTCDRRRQTETDRQRAMASSRSSNVAADKRSASYVYAGVDDCSSSVKDAYWVRGDSFEFIGAREINLSIY